MNKQKEQIKTKLLQRGFSHKKLMNNRGLISATIEETISLITKDSIEMCDSLGNKYLSIKKDNNYE